MNIKNLCEQLKDSRCDWLGVRYVDEHTQGQYVRDAKPEHNYSSQNRGIMLEVLCQGQFAWSSSSNLDESSLKLAYERAIINAQAASQYSVFKFNSEHRPGNQGRYTSPHYKEEMGKMSDINGRLIAISEKLKQDKRIIRSLAMLEQIKISSLYACSNGSDIEQNFSIVSSNMEVTAEDKGIVQTRSDDGSYAKAYQGGLERLISCEEPERIDRVREEAIELLYAEECPEKCCSLLLMPDQMQLQIHESIGHPLEIDRMLGDERNYAGSSFVKLDDIGSLEYGSSILNVCYDPVNPHQIASYGFDDQGDRAEETYIIKDGMLVNALGGLDSQARSGVSGVANARADSWYRPPIDRMSNLNIKADQGTREDMIAAVEDGILMHSNRSWSIDDYRHKFQFGCEIGYRIKDGEIKETLRNPNYRDTTVSFWHKLSKLGGPETYEVYGTTNCGKGEPNQVARVGHASPMALFEQVEVFGGAE